MSHQSYRLFFRNQELTGLIASIHRDLADSVFHGELPSNPTIRKKYKSTNSNSNDHSDDIDNMKPITIADYLETAEKEWTLRTISESAAFLGKGCQGSMMLAGHSDDIQKLAYRLGKYLAIAWKAWTDMDPFLSEKILPETRFSLVSVPVLLHLDHDPGLYKEIEKGIKSLDNINYLKVHEIIRSGPGLEMTKEILEKNCSTALTALQEFPLNDAKNSLMIIIQSMMFDS